MSDELVKPPSTPSRDKRLVSLGAVLVFTGLVAAAQFPSVASTIEINPTLGSDKVTVSWSLPAENHVVVMEPNYSENGHMLTLCEYVDGIPDADQQCVTATTTVNRVTGIGLSSNQNSITFYSYSRYRPPPQGSNVGVELGAGKLLAQIVYRSTTEPGNFATLSTTPIGSLMILDIPLTSQSSGNQGQQSGPQSGSQAPAPPPISLDIAGVASASALQAGKRDFTFNGTNMEDVVAIRVDGRSLPLFDRKSDSVKVRLPKLGPGQYDVIVYTEKGNWEIKGAVEIGEYLPEVRREVLDESFQKYSSELPKQTKQEIRSVIESTPNLKSVTVFAIAKREIIGEDRNKLARSRGAEAFDFVQKLAPDARIKVKLVHYSETDLTPRGLFFRVAQKG
jgi:hypothetical protein